MTEETRDIVERLNKAKDKLEKLSDSEKVKTVRSMPKPILKQTYKLIARKSPLEQCLQVVETLKTRIQLEPETAKECNDQEILAYFIKMLKKYKRIE